MKRIKVKLPFPIICDSNSKILILGSIPSVKSREYNFYYMHKQNRFWKLLARIFDEKFLSADIQEKRMLLKKYNIALYDVIDECYIVGSSDSSISEVIPTSIAKLIEKTSVTHIFLNGKKAYNLFKKYNPALISMATPLPSTSPANASYSFDMLYSEWKRIEK